MPIYLKNKPIKLLGVEGFTLIELCISLILLTSILLLLKPFIFTDFIKQQDTQIKSNQESRYVFQKIDSLFKQNVIFTQADPHELIFKAGVNTYHFFVSGFPGPAPYTLMLRINEDGPVLLKQNIDLLTNPDRPGFTIHYLNQESSPSTPLNSIQTITLTLNSLLEKKSTIDTHTIIVNTDSLSTQNL